MAQQWAGLRFTVVATNGWQVAAATQQDRRRRLRRRPRGPAALSARPERKFLAVIDEFPLLLSDRREERRGFLSELQKVNARISASVRGQFQDALRHLGAKAGCAVITVPARGTSAICPRCGRRLRHYTSPERLRSGHPWAHCSHCGLSADRDHAAAQRICARGLSSQPAVHQNRRTGHLAIRKAKDSQVARCLRRRSQLGPTTRPHAHPVPGLCRVLSPPAAAAVHGQRPEGGVPQVGVISTPGQDTSAQPCSTPPGHRPRWVSLGRGFHRNVHATTVVPRDDFGPKALGYAPLRVA